MAKLTKRQKAIAEKVVAGKQYSFEEAAKLLAELSTIKFKESVDVAVNLGVDPRKSDQVVRGATVLPNGTGKSVALPSSPRVRLPKPLWLPAPTRWVWTSWLPK